MAALVRENHCLDSISELKLGEDARYVGLNGRFAKYGLGAVYRPPFRLTLSSPDHSQGMKL